MALLDKSSFSNLMRGNKKLVLSCVLGFVLGITSSVFFEENPIASNGENYDSLFIFPVKNTNIVSIYRTYKPDTLSRGPSLINFNVKTRICEFEEYRNGDGVLHRTLGPAKITRNINSGMVSKTVWFVNGKEFEPSLDVLVAWESRSHQIQSCNPLRLLQ